MLEKNVKQLENNFMIIEEGSRNNEPIILVKKINKSDFEYIIGINYQIKEKEIVWDYGYYYSDLESAARDFYKGVYLCNTINENGREI